MNRRKDGRELYEVFKEQMASVSQPAKEAQVFRPEPKVKPLGSDVTMHTVRLGERRQVEIFLSMSWVYGLIFFGLLAVAGAFAAGRHFAPPPEQVEAIDAPEAFTGQAERVGDVTQVAPAPTPQQQAPRAAAERLVANRPASVTPPVQARAAAPATPVEVSSGGSYTFCVITYRDKGTAKTSAEDVANFLKGQGLPDVRLLSDKAHGNLIVAVGSFATKDSSQAADVKARLAKTSYKGLVFKDAYMTTLKGYE